MTANKLRTDLKKGNPQGGILLPQLLVGLCELCILLSKLLHLFQRSALANLDVERRVERREPNPRSETLDFKGSNSVWRVSFSFRSISSCS